MKLRLFLAIVAIFTLVISSNTVAQTQLKTKNDSISYAIGMSISQSFKTQGLDKTISLDIMKNAMKDAFTDDTNKLALKKDDIKKIFEELQKSVQEKQMAEMMVKGKEAKTRGDAFLAKNKANPNVKVTASGLQYEVITEGKGKKPLATNTVKVHYTGRLTDGKVFDSSVERGEPIEFPLNGVIKGWTEGVQLMTEGSKYKFTIPSDLGYGDAGAGGMIGPNEVLVFEVELISIKDTPAVDAAPAPTEMPDTQAKPANKNKK